MVSGCLTEPSNGLSRSLPDGAGLGTAPEDALEYRKQTTDIHLDNIDQSFRQHDALMRAANPFEDGGRPKYGRRRYPLTLFSADYDLLKI